MRPARFLRRRPPFRLALVGLVVLLTALTGVAIGGLAWREQRARSRALIDAAMAQAARLTAAHADRLLQDAESTARLGSQLVQQGQLDPADARALERFTRVERVKGLSDPAVVHRLLDVRTATAEEGDALTPAQEAARL